ARASYREMHDALEKMVLTHLLDRFDRKPTVLARATRMNRVTLRKKLNQMEGNQSLVDELEGSGEEAETSEND
ncbi:MAG: hypothetical protein ACO1QR_00305, partial [Chthoniobacteraceae bacterium]